MRQNYLEGLPKASVINAIQICSDNADWNTICKYLSGTVAYIAIRWKEFNEYLVDESVSMAYEKAWKYRESFDPEKGKLASWLNRIALSSIKTVLCNSYNAWNMTSTCDFYTQIPAWSPLEDEIDNSTMLSLLEDFAEKGRGNRALAARMMLIGCNNDEIGVALGKNKNATAVLKSRVRTDMTEYLFSLGYDINELIA